MDLGAVSAMGYVFRHPRGFTATCRSHLTKSRRLIGLSLMGGPPCRVRGGREAVARIHGAPRGVKRPHEPLRGGVARLLGEGVHGSMRRIIA